MILSRNLEIEIGENEILLTQIEPDYEEDCISITPEMVDMVCAELQRAKEKMKKEVK